ncbi:MAG: ribose-5-phosphate isomerase RpiA [Gammaproteobacteria bacterium]|nr:ribose-5-phosphate isomerase RpiA [Gammaproteobacteria bacterium]
MDQTTKKVAAAKAALQYVRRGTIIGVGTGSTVNCFIDALAADGGLIQVAVSSSEASTARLKNIGVTVADLNDIGSLDLYIDGADEANADLALIKGGGGALTREKIIAQAARTFVCMVDDSKMVQTLGAFPLPVEVIPMASRLVATAIAELGGDPKLRAGFVTDNGNHILDVHGLAIDAPVNLENELNQIPGIVTVGLFARRPADLLIVGRDTGVDTITR